MQKLEWKSRKREHKVKFWLELNIAQAPPAEFAHDGNNQ